MSKKLNSLLILMAISSSAIAQDTLLKEDEIINKYCAKGEDGIPKGTVFYSQRMGNTAKCETGYTSLYYYNLSQKMLITDKVPEDAITEMPIDPVLRAELHKRTVNHMKNTIGKPTKYEKVFLDTLPECATDYEVKIEGYKVFANCEGSKNYDITRGYNQRFKLETSKYFKEAIKEGRQESKREKISIDIKLTKKIIKAIKREEPLPSDKSPEVQFITPNADVCFNGKKISLKDKEAIEDKNPTGHFYENEKLFKNVNMASLKRDIPYQLTGGESENISSYSYNNADGNDVARFKYANNIYYKVSSQNRCAAIYKDKGDGTFVLIEDQDVQQDDPLFGKGIAVLDYTDPNFKKANTVASISNNPYPVTVPLPEKYQVITEGEIFPKLAADNNTVTSETGLKVSDSFVTISPEERVTDLNVSSGPSDQRDQQDKPEEKVATITEEKVATIPEEKVATIPKEIAETKTEIKAEGSVDGCLQAISKYFQEEVPPETLQEFLKIQGELSLHRLAWGYLQLAERSGSNGVIQEKLEGTILRLLKHKMENKDEGFTKMRDHFEKAPLSRSALAEVMPYFKDVLDKQMKDQNKNNLPYMINQSDIKMFEILAEKEKDSSGKLLAQQDRDESILNMTKIIDSSYFVSAKRLDSKSSINSNIAILQKKMDGLSEQLNTIIGGMKTPQECSEEMLKDYCPDCVEGKGETKFSSFIMNSKAIADAINQGIKAKLKTDKEIYKNLKYNKIWLKVSRAPAIKDDPPKVENKKAEPWKEWKEMRDSSRPPFAEDP